MWTMRRVLLGWMLGCGLAGVSACAAGIETAPPGRLARVYLSVYGWDGGRVEAMVIDRNSRRTGWTLEGQLREVAGCGSSSGSEDGIPNPRPDDADTAAVAAWERSEADTLVSGEPEPPPIYHHFDVSNDLFTPVSLIKQIGLIDQGGCELRLDPIVSGTVRLAVNASRAGYTLSEDTTSAKVELGVPARWRVSWKAVGGSCVVKMTRIRGKGTKGSR